MRGGGGGVEEFEDLKCSEMGGTNSRLSVLFAVENAIALTTSRGHDEKIKIVHNNMGIIMDELYGGQEEGFGVNSSYDECLNFFPAVV